MKRFLCLVTVLLLGGTVLAAPELAPPPAKPPVVAQKPPPGVEAAQALSTLTGVAISPLLGVGGVGAWKYYKASPEARSRLPWFAQPWFWVPALLVVGLVFLKDALGPSVPTALKKPFDLLELFENKLSALVAAGLFVPIISSIFQSAGDSSQLGSWGLAVIDLAPLYNLLLLPLALAAFVIVFLASHAINVLILISPFATLDVALKSFRLFLLSTVTLTSLANPYVGAAWALVLIVISYFIAGWSLRMSVFGTVLAWDLATFRRKRFRPAAAENWAFTARKLGNTPARSYGKLSRDDQGRLVLRYRPWLVLPERRLVLPEGTYAVGRGLFYPEIHRLAGADSQAQLLLPPRCRSHEEQLTSLYQLAPPRDTGLLRGLKGLRVWLKELLSFGKARTVNAGAVG